MSLFHSYYELMMQKILFHNKKYHLSEVYHVLSRSVNVFLPFTAWSLNLVHSPKLGLSQQISLVLIFKAVETDHFN